MTDTFEVSVYGRDDCPYCKKATSLLAEYDVSFLYHDVSEPEALRRLKELDPTVKTIPQIFKLDESGAEVHQIGGYDQLLELMKGMING